ncbi:MAG: exodeoxyribonuclease VII small subunit [Alcanivoracaceae bacterium]|nr:exodeoxyribonuclease VII small subunit [Alcanivoracaceae bacterium]
MAKKAQTSSSLEKTLETLEALVEKMESGDLSLEESLQAFEQGVRLTREAQQALQAAEQKVRILLQDDQEPEDFNANDNAD